MKMRQYSVMMGASVAMVGGIDIGAGLASGSYVITCMGLCIAVYALVVLYLDSKKSMRDYE